MIDLHCHSIFSDGTQSPEALALAAQNAGLKALALTDHDTLAGLDRFLACQPEVTTRLIPGIEFSCRFLDRPLHLLGLLLNHQDPVLGQRVEIMRARRVERNQAMVRRLQERGVPITWEAVAAQAPTDLISRTHFARALVRIGAAGSREDAFRRFIGDGGPCYVPFPALSPGEAARWVREAGGVAVVAHPGRCFPRGFRWDQAMLDLQRQGIQGLEAYYPDYGPQEHAYFLALAETLDLIPCGGSDHHGDSRTGRDLGASPYPVPDAVLDRLLAAAGTPLG